MYTTRLIGYDIQRELLRRTNGDNVPTLGDKPTMSAIEYNTLNVVGNANNHQNQHGVTTAAMLAANPSANLLCNYCPPAAKRKKPNNVGETIQMIGVDGRPIQARTVNAAALSATAVPISLTPVTNALIRQDARFNADDFDPVKIFGELTSTGLTTTTTGVGVIGTTDGTFGATLLGTSRIVKREYHCCIVLI